ncbi:MAG TPA: tRNA uridine(34) 5-carboxymethylaminomethyl modification radical SAM/GNAT enzyme Elp3 [Candidatus Thermoplasmatota archaeon]|nr:tRNA uridine(34) 5-carboxymethylaminomethyl modification radical SAM/GNAT enzyme Elp3 [Candidatus Thermoplasmatota archaeon]
MPFHQDIIELILSKKIQSKDELHKAKIQLCKKYNLRTIPRDSEILANLPADQLENGVAHSLLRKKSSRTLSGVAVIAAMTSPEVCPHGRCVPCPGGPERNTPQSYTGYEPAAMRASCNNFDPYLQVRSRVEQLHAIGHVTDKVDLIIMGGTFTARIPEYQQWFVKRCYDALNTQRSHSLDHAKKKNETAPSRCIGLTVETRPDWFRLQQVDSALDLGATRVELGVQTIDDRVLSQIKRGHTVSDSIAATRIAKDAGLKICYHMMPGLPGSTEKKDLETFHTLFTDERFKPDMIKIYPTLVIKGTSLYTLWKEGNYDPLTTEQASHLIATIKKDVPEWIRIQRIQRDIPAQEICTGITKSNLRQYVEAEMQKHHTSCRCIRCREIGHVSSEKTKKVTDRSLRCVHRRYRASDGDEFFISLEDSTQDVIVGYIRLRDVANPHRSELQAEPCMIIRELKVLGREASLGQRTSEAYQHRGFGKKLLTEADSICSEQFGKKRLYVLSGVGVKPYYRRLGFSDDGVYLSKVVSV